MLGDGEQACILQSLTNRGVIPGTVLQSPWHAAGDPSSCHPVVKTLKRLEDARSQNPRLGTLQKNLLDDRHMKHSGRFGICPFSHQDARDPPPFLTHFLEITRHRLPVGVILRQPSAEVLEEAHVLKRLPTGSEQMGERLSRILVREGADAKTSGMFHVAVVQQILL